MSERSVEANPVNEIRRTILVMSGKGGVGKSTVAVNLAVWLALRGQSTGLLDIDLHGPSVPKLLAMEEQKLFQIEGTIRPCEYQPNLKVMSIGFMLPNRGTAVIWRGPAKHGLLERFAREIYWGLLDYLVVDCPPGTGDEVLSIVQLLGQVSGALLVTTPQEVSLLDVRKCISFCKQMDVPLLGLIENMNGLVCPHCGKRIDVFGGGACRPMAEELGVPILGAVPMDPQVACAGDLGRPMVQSHPKQPAVQAIAGCFEEMIEKLEMNSKRKTGSDKMKFAIPMHNGKLSAHFGHCQQFAIITADPEKKEAVRTELLTPPAHEPGVLPEWLSEMDVRTVIAGGMGQRAQMLFRDRKIDVIVGAPDKTPQELVLLHLTGRLECGQNVCDH